MRKLGSERLNHFPKATQLAGGAAFHLQAYVLLLGTRGKACAERGESGADAHTPTSDP